MTLLTPQDELAADFLHELSGWETAYPLSAFPEPDLKRAAELLKAGGMTLDAISASNMRHVVQCIAPKARAVIAALTPSAEAVERVARALAKADGWEICSDASYAFSKYGPKAVAAIAAMGGARGA